MTTVIEKITEPLVHWYHNSSIHAFFTWWVAELKGLVPEAYRATFFPQSLSIYMTDVQGSDDEVKVWEQQQSQVTPVSFDDAAASAAWWHQLNHHLAAVEVATEVTCLLDEANVLTRNIAMPTAVYNDVESVLTFELDKYIPFKADDVVFACNKGDVVEDSEKFPVTLTAIKKQELHDLVELFEAKGVQLSSIDVNVGTAEQPIAMGVNLLPKGVRKKKDLTKIKWNVALSGVAMALLWFVMYSSLENKDHKIESLDVQVKDLRREARRAKLIETQLTESVEAANFLGNLKQTTPSRLMMFNELTQKIPMNTYLTRIMIDEERLEVIGQSDNANALIPILNQSTMWNEPEIIGNVTQDARTNKEKFTIRSSFKSDDQEEVGNES